jgi:hypothetical protein
MNFFFITCISILKVLHNSAKDQVSKFKGISIIDFAKERRWKTVTRTSTSEKNIYEAQNWKWDSEDCPKASEMSSKKTYKTACEKFTLSLSIISHLPIAREFFPLFLKRLTHECELWGEFKMAIVGFLKRWFILRAKSFNVWCLINNTLLLSMNLVEIRWVGNLIWI